MSLQRNNFGFIVGLRGPVLWHWIWGSKREHKMKGTAVKQINEKSV